MKISDRPSCPFCGSKNVARILYGFPAFSEELDRQLKRKEVVLGGCMVFDDAEQWECQDCKWKFS